MEPASCASGSTQSQDGEPSCIRRLVFVGSSSADLDLASQVAECLSQVRGVCGKCWTDEFPLGLLTFEAREQMLHMCVGAVFIVTTEDHGRPSNNVMIEVGLVAGRMGRSRVAQSAEFRAQQSINCMRGLPSYRPRYLVYRLRKSCML